MKILKFCTGLLILPLSLSLAACSGSPSFSLLADKETFVGDNSAASNKIDVLFVINDQPSMSSFQDEIVTSFSSFMQQFDVKGFNYKIAVVTSSAYLADPTLTGYSAAHATEDGFNDFNGTTHSGVFTIIPTTPNLFSTFAINAKPAKNSAGQDGRAFSSMRQALRQTNPINAGFVRPDAFLAVVIVDNQDDFSSNARCPGCNMNQRYNYPSLDPVTDYVAFLDTVTGTSGATKRYSVSAMTQSAAPCQGGTTMTRIMELANLTSGVIGNICDADFGPSMVLMAEKIASLSTQYYLDRTPIESSIVIKVDGVLIPNDAINGWTYDSVANSILFHGDAIPQQGAIISVDFDPASYGS